VRASAQHSDSFKSDRPASFKRMLGRWPLLKGAPRRIELHELLDQDLVRIAVGEMRVFERGTSPGQGPDLPRSSRGIDFAPEELVINGGLLGEGIGRHRASRPNGSRLSCGRNARGRKETEPQIKRLASESTQFFPTCERPSASSAC